VSFGANHAASATLNLAEKRRAFRLFAALSTLIPSGGHAMVSYEDDGPIHKSTRACLSMRFPPVVTPLGILLFKSGFYPIRDWYLSEGGHEGPRKLWGDKEPLDEKQYLREQLKREVRGFLACNSSQTANELTHRAREHAHEIVKVLSPEFGRKG
jgi:hypothetical protein